MMNRIKTAFLAILAVGFFTACNEGGADAKDEARQAIEANTVTPAATASNAAATPTADAQVPTGPTTTLSFRESEFDFGTIQEGDVATHTYSFTNTGKEPLIISNAKGSCGCTVPSWPREPIAPGESGEIKVEFNSKGKSGMQSKKVTITANTTPPQTFLTIKGNVNKVQSDDAAKQMKVNQ